MTPPAKRLRSVELVNILMNVCLLYCVQVLASDIRTFTANNDQEEGARKNSMSSLDHTGMSCNVQLPRLISFFKE